MREPRAGQGVEKRAVRGFAPGRAHRSGLWALLLLLCAAAGSGVPVASEPLPAAPADTAVGIVRFLFESPPGASPAELCRLVEVRAVRLVPRKGAPPHEEPVTKPAPVRGEADGSYVSWDRSCRFTLRGLEPGSSYRIRARLLPSPWWGQGWEYQEVCPLEGGIAATGVPKTYRCNPIRR